MHGFYKNVIKDMVFMSVLPLLLIALLSNGEKFSSIKEFLSHIDFNSFSPVFKLFGLNENIIGFLCSEQFSSMLSGNLDLKSLLPILTSFLSPKTNNEKQKEDCEAETPQSQTANSDYFAPIKDIIPSDIEEQLFTA